MRIYLRLALALFMTVILVAPTHVTAKVIKPKWKSYDKLNYDGAPDPEKWGVNQDDPGSVNVSGGKMTVAWPNDAEADLGRWLQFLDCPENIVGAKATFYPDEATCSGSDVHIHFGWHPGSYDNYHTWMDFGFNPQDNIIRYGMGIEDWDYQYLYRLFNGDLGNDGNIDLFGPGGVTIAFYYDKNMMAFTGQDLGIALEEPLMPFGSALEHSKGMGLWASQTGNPCTFDVENIYVMRKGPCDKKAPKVKSTIPKKNKKNIPVDTDEIVITFNESMQRENGHSAGAFSITPDTGWDLDAAEWISPNTFSIPRSDSVNLPAGTIITVALNPPDDNAIVDKPHDWQFRDLKGFALKPYSFKFTTEVIK